MPFIVYLAILTAAVFSVVLEWDALVERPPAARHTLQAVISASPLPSIDTAAPVTRAQMPAETLPPAQPATAETPAAHCDVDACTGAYRSFRASDCTWQPNEGPRRLCTKGNPPQ
jgi:hypothetical protein